MTDHSDVNDRNSWSYPDLQSQLSEQPRTFVYQTQPFTISEQLAEKKKKEKKCHSNRKLQHFKRKCRARGLTEEQIHGLIQTKHHTISEPSISVQLTTCRPKQSNKRKRDLYNKKLLTKRKKARYNSRSLSSKDNTSSSNKHTCTVYKQSKYLRMPRKLFQHSLRLQLKHPLKRKKERHFIVERLQLLDQQFYLDHIRSLYQTYFNQGLKFHMWSDDILKIAQTTERSVIQKYPEEYLILLRDEISQCTTELAIQSSSCPLTLSLLEIVDARLHEFVRLHHIDLMRTIRFRINKLKDEVHEKQLFQHLSYYYLNNDQFKAISRLTTIRKKQLKVFEEQTMLEQQILCHRLPESHDSIVPNLDMKKLSKKHCKMVQKLKRLTLNLELQRYEEDIHRYEQLYQEEFNKLQQQILNPTSSDYKHQIDILMYSVESYLNNYKHRLLRQIRHREAYFHTNLIRQRRRRQSFMRENNIQVHPQIIVDVPKFVILSSMTDHSDVNDRNSWSYPALQSQLSEQPRTFVYQTQPFTISEQLAEEKKKEKKCHGNRKLQHFKRKCRAHGLTEEQIQGLIQTKHHTISEPSISVQLTTCRPKQSNKRKRDLYNKKPLTKRKKARYNSRSLSSKDNTSSSNKHTCTVYKQSKYLRMPRKLLLHSLRLQLKHPLKRKKERHFIVERLQLLDQQFYLDHIRCLYQTYFDQGLKFHMWPDGILKIAQITERTVIQKYLEEYLILLRDKISQCTTELATQSSPCPLTLSLLNIVDVRLHEFVRLHHIDLMRTIRFRINKLKDKIHEKQLFQHLSYYYLNNDQFKAISRLTTIRKEQLKVFDEQTMLEQQILCHQLPESLDSILPNLDMKKLSQKHCKMVQELKRFTLNLELQRYEEDIHRYEQLYQEEFNKLQEQIQNPTSSDYKHQIDILMYSVESYLNNYKHRLLRQIRHREACFHTNLIRQRRRLQSLMRENNIQAHP
ncbi:unnamed protein product [Adineta ricciae]|uniref:Uncharacterized protein n=1 Tax=Adineta ricciae TaxID=249248 RepID=A0A815PHP2_ADIRI|nr:unnamed protein product [Adineta ricciae]